ncbi:hypothetical protein FA15DRAFT_616175 [Coprinopsis marcescibilis]|uniref:Uncharacterized protein n=1 Tax=Coprinopsis marcescibilis TaxID=230819 RepID=A0A5C3L0H7_COPMA|nr:hypothetical protein FA15DRAFT_616175 [Coprinopsis marcescibilis]
MSTFAESTQPALFEAPTSAGAQPVSDRKHFSIDLSLELERQLEMESPPPTPARDLTSAVEDTQQKHEALDPEILAHLVMQLRQSLSVISKERDELAKLLAASHNKEATLNDALQLMTEKATETGEELDQARKKMREDEEAIVLLRAKVEESRRGLMRLQTENRRQTMAPIDVNRASLLGGSSPPVNKRASFTPMTGRSNAHRRISSVSDIGLAIADLRVSPKGGQTLTLPDTGGSSVFTPPPTGGLRFSASPRHSPPLSPKSECSPSELDELRGELKRIKQDLETARHDLVEAIEGKEASETCVKALREFIADTSFSEAQSLNPMSIKLPPPPTMTTGDELDSKRPPASGWAFKLWGGDSPRVPSAAVPQSATIGSPHISGTPTLPSAPITRKLTGFFGSRASISSTKSTPFPPLQTNASAMQRNISHDTSSSDASSVTEPISPSDDIHGLGTHAVVVRDSANLSDVGSIRGVVEIKSVPVDVEIIR